MWGSQAGSGWGVYGTSDSSWGVYGLSANGGDGVFGSSPNGTSGNAGVRADSGGLDSNGVIATANNGTSAYGVWGQASAGYGGVFSGGYTGVSASGAYGVQATGSNTGVYASGGSYGGLFYGGPYGVQATGTTNGVFGQASSGSGGDGVFGTTDTGLGSAGVRGTSTASDGNGVIAEADTGSAAFALYALSASGYAGWFSGNVNVTGTLTKGAGAFKIDHPLNPAHYYLQHSFVESPEMMNVYNDTVTTDAQGFATVTMPDYFQALNRTFRYQLTVVGRSFAQAIVWNQIANNQFTIRTNQPNIEVSWQVTGVRHDKYANAHRIQVVVAKTPREQGFYLHPELYGKPASKSIDRAYKPNVARPQAKPARPTFPTKRIQPARTTQR